MANSTVKIVGLKQFNRKIQDLSDKELQAMLTKCAIIVEEDAKDFCPSSGYNYPGLGGSSLKESITHEVEGNTAAIGTNKEYAPYVHQGTGIYAVNGDGRKTPWTYYDERTQQFYTTVGQLPNPFLTAALQNQQNEIIKIVNDAVKDHLDD